MHCSLYKLCVNVFTFFPFQIDLEPVDIDLERVVENDACVESGNHHGVEEVSYLF